MKKITNLKELSNSLITEFYEVTTLAQSPLGDSAIKIDYWGVPHTHTVKPLEKNKVAVYVFVRNGECLKVGKVGSKSQARYVSHHYNALSSKSNLAKSISECGDSSEFDGFTKENAGKWIKENVERVNFVLAKDTGIAVLNLLEAYLQYRLEPRFEGFKNQR